VKWGPIYTDPSQTGLWAGPPTLADLDGDGALEVAVAGHRYFSVLEADGTLKWRAPIEETTTATGSVAFDFDGDGAAELVYGDHFDVRIYRGSDVILFSTARLATGVESPVARRGTRRGRGRPTDNWWAAIPGSA
jgi:hypothetical protein